MRTKIARDDLRCDLRTKLRNDTAGGSQIADSATAAARNQRRFRNLESPHHRGLTPVRSITGVGPRISPYNRVVSDHELLRHTVATLAYRAGKALRDAPSHFADF